MDCYDNQWPDEMPPDPKIVFENERPMFEFAVTIFALAKINKDPNKWQYQLTPKEQLLINQPWAFRQ